MAQRGGTRWCVIAVLGAFFVAGSHFAAGPGPAAQEGTRLRPGSEQSVRGSSVEIHDDIPVVRPDFPEPDEPGMLFYLQRSTNSNTIVYAANFLDDGTLDPDEPVVAYWRRFNTTGERKPLKMIEDNFAFGIRAQATDDPNVFKLYVVSYADRKATLKLVNRGARKSPRLPAAACSSRFTAMSMSMRTGLCRACARCS